MKKGVLWFLALLVLVMTFATPARAYDAAPCVSTHIVRRGEWLAKIAQRTHTSWFAIMSATNAQAMQDKSFTFIENPDRIKAGWKLCIPAAVKTPAGLTVKDLANATYTSELAPGGQVTLKNGRASMPVAPGSATQYTARLTQNIAYGEIDGVPSAAVILVESGGGSGIFYSLHVVQAPQGTPVDVAYVMLGDRIRVNSLYIIDDKVVVGITTQGPDDPMISPTQRVVTAYTLSGNELVEVGEVSAEAATPAATASPAVIAPATGDTEQMLRSAIWQWEQTQYSDDTLITAADPNRYQLEFLAGGRVAIQADCNRVLGAYTLDGTNLTIQLGPSTLVACPPDSQDQEFLKALAQVGSVLFQDDKLHLLLQMDSGTMTFRGSDPTALAGTEWQVTGINNGRQAVVSVVNGTTVTLNFSADGKVSGSSGCNQYTGPYEVNGDQITVGLLFSTRKLCSTPEGIMEQEAQFLDALQAGTTFKISGNQLVIRDATDAMQVTAAR